MVSDPWSAQWETRNHVLLRLARYFHVVWVNPAREWREILRGPRLPASPVPEADNVPSFRVYEPEPWLPKVYRPRWLAASTARRRVQNARSILARAGCRKLILYLWKPRFAPAMRVGYFDLSCYHIDDEYSFSPVELPTSEEEMNLLRSVDQVFIHSPASLEKKGWINPHTVLVPNGVDYHAFSSVVAEPPDLQPIPHPRIGYTGYLKEQLDWGLLLELATRHPAWSFVFVGGERPGPSLAEQMEPLRTRPNVYFLGAKTTREMAAYPQHFDVCIMPYRADGYTKFIYPLKLHEYLASGCPVVSTHIRSSEEFSDVVSLARDSDEWSSALAQALRAEANTIERRATRQGVARRHEWEVIVSRIAQTLAQRLGPEYGESFDAAGECTGESPSATAS
jgi:glycosyltransferase involved in cell wall biosynthesis